MVIWEKMWAGCDKMGVVIVQRVTAAVQRVELPVPFTRLSPVHVAGKVGAEVRLLK